MLSHDNLLTKLILDIIFYVLERVTSLYNEKEKQKAEITKYFGYYKSERVRIS